MKGLIMFFLFGAIPIFAAENADLGDGNKVYLDNQISMLLSANRFANNLSSCRSTTGQQSYLKEGREGECYWMRTSGGFIEHDNDIGFKETSGSVSGGMQFALAPGWYGGFAVGYEYTDLENDWDAVSESNRFKMGTVLKYQTGPLTLSGSVSGGISWFDTERSVNFLSTDAQSDHRIKYAAAQLRIAYLESNGNWYFNPQIDLNFTYLSREEATETRAGEANLTVAGFAGDYWSFSPAVEVGWKIATKNGRIVQPYVKAGATFFDRETHGLSAHFTVARSAVGAFTIEEKFGDTFTNVSSGIIVTLETGVSLSVGYEGSFGHYVEQHVVFLKTSKNF